MSATLFIFGDGKWPIERVNKRRAFGAQNETWTDGSTFRLEPYWAADKLTSPWGLSPFGPFIYGRRTRVIPPSVLQWKQTKKATGFLLSTRSIQSICETDVVAVSLTRSPALLFPLCTGRRREKERIVTGFIKCLAIDDVDEQSLSIPVVEAAHFVILCLWQSKSHHTRAGDSARNETPKKTGSGIDELGDAGGCYPLQVDQLPFRL